MEKEKEKFEAMKWTLQVFYGTTIEWGRTSSLTIIHLSDATSSATID